MKTHCSNDGGFIGEGGCSHRHHVHSPLVQGIIDATSPRMITAEEGEAALKEQFYVTDKDGKRCAFGERCYTHVHGHHTSRDASGRLERLMYAVDTVKTTSAVQSSRSAGVLKYAKAYKDFGMLVLADRSGTIQDIFDIIPSSRGRLK